MGESKEVFVLERGGVEGEEEREEDDELVENEGDLLVLIIVGEGRSALGGGMKVSGPRETLRPKRLLRRLFSLALLAGFVGVGGRSSALD